MTDNFENVNHLVLNFYSDGYSIAVKLNEFPVFTSETILETARIPYEETSLLDYIENEELPPLLVEMIDSSPKLSQYKIWHNGCLILEVRDKIDINQDESFKNHNSIKDNNKQNINFNNSNINIRGKSGYRPSHNAAKDLQSAQNYSHNNDAAKFNSPWLLSQTNNFSDCLEHENGIEASKQPKYNSFFILLKPTNLSMLYDVLNLTDSKSWSTQDRLQLESQIVLHNSPPLFLEPDASKIPNEPSSLWSDSDSSNKHSRHKRKLPHTRLKIVHSSSMKTSYNYYYCNGTGSNNNNLNKTKTNNNGNGKGNHKANSKQQDPADSLPPELTLQQFLAARRVKKKNLLIGPNAPRFQRFKRHMNGVHR